MRMSFILALLEVAILVMSVTLLVRNCFLEVAKLVMSVALLVRNCLQRDWKS